MIIIMIWFTFSYFLHYLPQKELKLHHHHHAYLLCTLKKACMSVVVKIFEKCTQEHNEDNLHIRVRWIFCVGNIIVVVLNIIGDLQYYN